MKVFVIGSGGREHALVWKLAKSPIIKKIFCAPGNAGIQALAECVPIGSADLPKLLAFAKENRIDLTVVGPEGALAEGIVDLFQKEGLKIFGPTQGAARLESSKIFTKEFCGRHRIPQGSFGVFDDPAEAWRDIEARHFPLVVKADGLAQGKGVVICRTKEEALQAVSKIGPRIVIEEFLEGEEASFIAMVDGKNILPLASAKDHKRLLDGDQGPNTGGMGAFSPSPLVTPPLHEKIMEKIMKPAVEGMRKEGNPFTGFLYAGLMIADAEPKLLEFNARLGDPETQVILPRLKNDFADLILKGLEGKLNEAVLEWDPRAASCVVMVSGGYPEKYETGFPIRGLKKAASPDDVLLFHAGTAVKEGKIATAGGRVLGVTALGKNVARALEKAYQACEKISWRGSFYRRDIGGSDV